MGGRRIGAAVPATLRGDKLRPHPTLMQPAGGAAVRDLHASSGKQPSPSPCYIAARLPDPSMGCDNQSRTLTLAPCTTPSRTGLLLL